MLRITPAAGTAIKRLVAGRSRAGLRVHARAGEGRLSLSVATLPEETDLVVTEATTGARVLVDSSTAEYLADKVLDVDDSVTGTIRFQLSGGT
ncbi:hypothetical protein [Actinophytocola xanthii]|uniref:Fe-S cluster assembly protein HesB n=1 Tax=Actinophytocola xanthii TaxID=1912961 RepID=A0A1Q8C7N1_9PSEU|nr:hypothetical protein [Actinophytocola xanthii]OLF10348.1 hypothetical protein BU204_32050 [Actinophytocola xanthii]